MRPLPRTPRRFRPVKDDLEALAPVSSLVPGLPAAAPVTAVHRLTPSTGRVDVPAPVPTRGADGPAPLFVVPIRTGWIVLTSEASDATSRRGSIPRTYPSSTAAQRVAGQAVAVSTPSASAAVVIPSMAPRTTVSSAVVPRGGGMALHVAPGMPARAVPGAPPAASSGLDTLADSSNTIRPMTLAPSAAAAVLPNSGMPLGPDGTARAPGDSAALASLHGGPSSRVHSTLRSSPGVDTSDGTPPPDGTPPLVRTSGGGTSGVSSDGSLDITNVVPVGSIITFSVDDPDLNHHIDKTQTSWNGGTDYVSYLPNQSADGPPPQQAQVQTGVDKRSSDYTFIVDAAPRTYTITVSVAYTNGMGGGQSTITFTSAKPSNSFSVGSPGRVTVDFTVDPDGNRTGLYAGMVWQPSIGADNRIKFTGDTSYETRSQMVGSFMVLQLINDTAVVTLNDGTPNGATRRQWTENNYVIDDGFDPAPHPIGQPLIEGGYSWASVQYDISVANAFDAPILVQPGLFNKSISITDSFKTYLMYQPSVGGVWIALKEFDWNISASANNTLFPSNQFYNWVSDPPVQANPTSSTPSGGGEFPQWFDDANSLRGFNPV